jgi:predicted permease
MAKERWLAMMIDRFWHDLVFGLRQLRKSPVFAAAVVLTLGLGVGVNTAVFSVVNAIVLRPLPVRDSDRLVVIASQNTSTRLLRGVSFPDLEDYSAATHDVFEDIAAYSVGFLGLARRGSQAERVLVTWVTGNYFQMLEVQAVLGRVVRPDEGGRGHADAVVVLGYSTWHRKFGGDPSVVGQMVRVNGRPCTIVGVLPPEFVGTFAFSDSELYLPFNWSGTADFDDRQARGLHAVARLKHGATAESAQRAVDAAAHRLAREYPDANANVTSRVLPERFARPEEDQFRSNLLAAALMVALVVLVMAVAAVNVTNLLLARAAARHQEFAIRVALGASRGRMVRQLVTETLMLAGLGGGAGLFLGSWTARVLSTMRLPGNLPVRLDFHLDGRVLTYALTVTVVTGVLVGLVPAVRVSRVNLEASLRHSQHGWLGAHGNRARRLMVTIQIGVCFVLLAAAGLFVRSLSEAERADLGFQPGSILNVHMDVALLGYTEEQGRIFFEEVDRRVRAIQGIEQVSFAVTIPMGYVRLSDTVEAQRSSVGTRGEPAGKNIVGSDYFRTMGIQIVRGRSFDATDNKRSRPVAIVNRHLADVLWPGRDPIGQRFKPVGPSGRWLEVVGVTNTGKYRFLFEDPQSYFYVPMAQEYSALRVLQLRTSIPPASLAPDVERTVGALEPNLPLYDVQSMTRALEGGPGFFLVRVSAVGAAALGLLALALAVVGLYGVISCLTAQRTREIGVRMAVGASQHDIVRLILRDCVRLVTSGIAAGIAVTLACSGVFAKLLFGVSGHDPLTLVVIATVFGSVALIACAVPTWRAARVDPITALRSE